MITRLPGNILNKHAINVLTTAKASSSSWFLQIRDLCLQYCLPHPLTILQNPPPKETYKRLVKLHVLEFWQDELRSEAAPLTSLEFFKPEYMSLSRPHPIWITAGHNPYQTNKAIVQARMLSGRYRTEALCRFWSVNKAGKCLLPSCHNHHIKEDITHILVQCMSLLETRQHLGTIFFSFVSTRPYIVPIIEKFLKSDDTYFQTQFLLDCSVLPEVIHLHQCHGFQILEDLFYLTRCWCYAVHRDRLRQLNRWNIQ